MSEDKIRKIEAFRTECPDCCEDGEVVSENDFMLHLHCTGCGKNFSRSKLKPMDKKVQKEFLEEQIQELTKSLDTLVKFYDTESDLTPHKAIDALQDTSAFIAASILKIKEYILWLDNPKKWYKKTQRRRD